MAETPRVVLCHVDEGCLASEMTMKLPVGNTGFLTRRLYARQAPWGTGYLGLEEDPEQQSVLNGHKSATYSPVLVLRTLTSLSPPSLGQPHDISTFVTALQLSMEAHRVSGAGPRWALLGDPGLRGVSSRSFPLFWRRLSLGIDSRKQFVLPAAISK